MNKLKQLIEQEITEAVETMTSLEIVKLINMERSLKLDAPVLRHSDFMSKVTQVLGLRAERDFSSGYLDANNQQRKCYKLPRRETMLMLMSYSYDLQAAVYDRMQELESQVQALPDFSNPAEAARAWATEYEQKQVALEKLEEAKPKVEFFDNLVDRKTLMNATQVGQKIGLSAVKLNKCLDDVGGIYNKAIKRGRVFTTDWISKGYGELKQTEMGHSQSLFTPAGEAKIHELLTSEGVI